MAAAAGKLNERNRQLLRGLIYPVQFEQRPEKGIDRVISAVVEKHALNATPQEYLAAVRSGLASSEKLASLIPGGMEEVVVRDYLGKVLARLSASSTRRPIQSAAKKKVASSSVTLTRMGRLLAEQHELPKRQGAELMSDLVTMITEHLRKGERVKIAGLGVLQVRKRAARMGRNPATGEVVRLKAGKKVAFRPSKELKDAI